MPSRRRPPQPLDADHCDDSGEAAAPRAEAPISVAEAEEEAARAKARAEAARARAIELRQQAEAAFSDQRDTTDSADAKDGDTIAVEEGADAAEPPSLKPGRQRLRWMRRLRRPGWKAVGVGAAIILISASLGASGYMAAQHHTLVHKRQLASEFAAAARQGVVTLMSIDANHAKEDFQRIIDNSTGQLKGYLQATAIYLVKNAEDAKVSTKATVDVVAVESMTDNSAVVLVVAKSDTTNPDNTKRPPTSWRLSVDLNRDDGQLKMSKVEFL